MTEAKTETKLDWGDTPDMSQQRLDYFLRTFRMLWELVGAEKRTVLIATLLSCAVSGLHLVFPYLFSRIIDTLPSVVGKESIGTVIPLLIFGMFVARISSILLVRLVKEPMFLKAIIRLENYWPVLAQEKLLALSAGYHSMENTGKKIAKINKGIEKMASIMCDSFWMLLPALAYLSLNIPVLFMLDWRIGLAFVAPIPIAIVIEGIAYRKLRPLWEKYEVLKEKGNGVFCQSVLNVRTVQSFVQERGEYKNLGEVRGDMCSTDVDACLREQKYNLLLGALMYISFTVTVGLGVYFVWLGWSTAGTVAYLFVTGSITLEQVFSVMHVYHRTMRNAVAVERMTALMHEDVDVADEASGVIPNVYDGKFALNDVSLVYPRKETPVLQDFSLEIRPGEMLALVGPSGSGKSTIVNLLARVYDPTGGSVTIDDTDARAVDRDWFRSRFAFVPQEIDIFDGTIRQNVAYAHMGANEEMVRRAIEAASFTEVLEDADRFPDGVETQVGERGIELSGGEKQRVGIARAYVALLSGASVLVLDEATSSLDSQSERVVQSFVEKLRKERDITIVAIAHRLSTISRADRICVLDKGKIVEMGDHDRLLEKNGLYARLVKLQELGELRE